jgi:hypothetical protein
MKHLFTSENDFGRLVNKELTSKLIKLHSKGYDLDFYMNRCDHLVCVQSGEEFPCACIMVQLVDQIYDFITNSFKYVHTVDTVCGRKGIMVMEGIYDLQVRLPVIQLVPVDNKLLNYSSCAI